MDRTERASKSNPMNRLYVLDNSGKQVFRDEFLTQKKEKELEIKAKEAEKRALRKAAPLLNHIVNLQSPVFSVENSTRQIQVVTEDSTVPEDAFLEPLLADE